MRTVWRNFRGAFARLAPDAVTQAQAVAFNMFLAFFPALLLALGVLSSSEWLSGAVEGMLSGLSSILPPGSRRLVMDYLTQRGPDPWKAIVIGLGGTLMVGAQVMTGLMQGFDLIYRDITRPSFWSRQGRALALLVVTLVPWMAVSVLTVFGRQVRGWVIQQFGLPSFFRAIWLLVYLGLALVVATLTLAVVYRVGRRGCRGWNEVLPGAVAATLLWWLVNAGFGFYVRHVPYSIVYGGLAAAIGLMVWMYLSVVVVLIGAAYNAEARSAEAPLGQPAAPALAEADTAPPS